MAVTFELIETVTVGAGGAASIAFSSIPQTYTDLVVVVSARSSYSALGDDIYIDFNGTTTNRTGVFVFGSGSGVASLVNPARRLGTNVSDTATANVFGSITAYIPNYTSSSYKPFSSDSVTENNGTTAYTDLHSGLWSNSAAITSIEITPGAGGGNLKQYSSASLYGIKNS